MHPYLTTAALILPLLPILWLYTAHISHTPTFQKLRNKRICLLIAHPDDEAMFFAPTLLALTDPAMGNHVKILCLSTGNAASLGPLRKTELLSSALILGLRSTADVFVLDSPDFPDSMSTAWDAGKIASVLVSAFAPSSSSFSSASTSTSAPVSNAPSTSQPPPATIDILLTFDLHGVSAHPNHTSLYHGALAFLRLLMRNHAGWDCPVTLYTLTSTSLVRKYISVLDAPLTMLLAVLGSMRASRSRSGRKRGEGRDDGAARLLFVSGPWEYVRALKAMVKGHWSQMRWFRWGWVGVGRFMVVNDLRRERVV